VTREILFGSALGVLTFDEFMVAYIQMQRGQNTFFFPNKKPNC